MLMIRLALVESEDFNSTQKSSSAKLDKLVLVSQRPKDAPHSLRSLSHGQDRRISERLPAERLLVLNTC
jgi:hypothetical protein